MLETTQVDIDKLAFSVAMAETGDCTKGIGPKTNNCFGIMQNGHPKHYTSKNESYEDFKRIWSSYYGGFPTREQAKRYTGNDSPDTWLENVRHHYYN